MVAFRVRVTQAILLALPLIALVAMSYILRGLPARAAASLALGIAASACVGAAGVMLLGGA